MSTNASYGWRMQGKDYLLYCHHDGYPEGLGLTMLRHARNVARNVGHCAEAVMRADHIDRAELPWPDPGPTPEQEEKLRARGLAPGNVDSGSSWYAWTASSRGNPDLDLANGLLLIDNEFITQSLHCEWAYIVNLDTRKLEVYDGFHDHPVDGRYGDVSSYFRSMDRDFYGCRLLGEFDLDGLPDDGTFIDRVTLWAKRGTEVEA